MPTPELFVELRRHDDDSRMDLGTQVELVRALGLGRDYSRSRMAVR